MVQQMISYWDYKQVQVLNQHVICCSALTNLIRAPFVFGNNFFPQNNDTWFCCPFPNEVPLKHLCTLDS